MHVPIISDEETVVLQASGSMQMRSYVRVMVAMPLFPVKTCS